MNDLHPWALDALRGERVPIPDSAGTCEPGCCEWDDSGKVLRYAAHVPPTLCAWCDDAVEWDDPDRVEVGGNVYCSEKCAGKTDHDDD